MKGYRLIDASSAGARWRHRPDLAKVKEDHDHYGTRPPEARLYRCRSWRQGIPGFDRPQVQLLHPGQAQADPLRGRDRRGPARPAALPRPGLAVRVLRRQGRLPAGLDRAQGVGFGPARAGTLPGLRRQGLRLAGPRVASVPRPERGVGAYSLPLQRQRRPAAQPEHRCRQAVEGVRAVEPELDPLCGTQRRRLDACRPRARALPVRQRQPAGSHEHAQQRDLGEQHAPDPVGARPGAVQPDADRGDRRIRRRGAHRDLEQRPGVAGRARDRRGADCHRRLVRGYLRRQRGVRAAGGRAVPEPSGAARGTAQWGLRHPHGRRRGGVRLRRAGPAVHHGDVPPADPGPRVRRPQQRDPAAVAVDLGAARDHRIPHAAAALVPARREAASLRGRPGRGEEPFQRNPVRAWPGNTEGVGTVTTFTTTESPYKSDHTASNMCGFTLMNNQVGVVVAEVMSTKPNVRVMPLPSMIRVDALRRMDVIYDEISEALGEEPGFFDAAEFEENMSTHYGRMIHEDDRTIMFANPEDAAEYIGFDLTAE